MKPAKALFATHRRRFLTLGPATLLCGALLGPDAGALDANKPAPPRTKRIGGGKEAMPIVGIGTNRFRLEKLADLRAVLKRMAEMGGTLIDTAAAYGESEETIGQILAELGLRERFFLATKLAMPPPGGGQALTAAESLQRSFVRLKTDRLDLLQVHNLIDTAKVMPELLAWRAAGKIRYIGLTTSRAVQHEQLIAEMNGFPVDFIQVDYSLGNRAAATAVLPAALRKKVAVLINLPLGGGRGENLVAQAGARELPPFAQRLGIRSWGQFCLSYVVSHPAVSCAIPGSTQLKNLEDNQSVARLPMLSARQRRQMEEFWDREVAKKS
jgi:aryl-alcohol dehydrogenase-like predicted oxidoreductase